MTALVMVVGMLPMALGLGEGGEQNKLVFSPYHHHASSTPRTPERHVHTDTA